MTADDPSIDRRSLMKKAAMASVTAGLAAGAATGNAAGQPGRPAERAEAEELLDDHAGDLLAMLSDEGLLDRAEIDQLPVDRPAPPEAATLSRPGTTMVQAADERDRLTSVTEVAAGMLSVTVEPETGRAYAFLEDGESVTIFDPEVGRVEETDAEVTADCSGFACCDTCTSYCYEGTSYTYAGREATLSSCCIC